MKLNEQIHRMKSMMGLNEGLGRESFEQYFKRRIPFLKEFVDLSTDDEHLNFQNTTENQNVKIYIPSSELIYTLPQFDIITQFKFNKMGDKYELAFYFNFDIEYPKDMDEQFKRTFDEQANTLAQMKSMEFDDAQISPEFINFVIRKINENIFKMPKLINKYLMIPDINTQLD